MARVLVTRPADAAAATAARLAALGHHAIVAPLFEIVPIDWTPPSGGFDALILTSAAAPRYAGAGLSPFLELRCYCVGERTAKAARAAGLADVRAPANGGVAELLAAIAADGVRRALHLGGRQYTDTNVPESLTLERRAVYESRPRTWTEVQAAEAASAETALLYSPRGAARLCGSIETSARHRLRVAALSAAVADAAGSGWLHVAVAARPNEDALFAAAGLMCEKRAAK